MVSPTTPPKVKIMGLGNNREVSGVGGGVVGASEEDTCSLFPSLAQSVSITESLTATPIFSNDIKPRMAEGNDDESGLAGVCGLGNLGNTCFLAAGVQCLVATPPLASALMATLPQVGMAPLTRELARLTKLIWSGEYSALRPTKFKDSLGKHFPQFNDYRQHDCQEFLALLLDGLHEQLNSASIKKDLTNQGDNFSKFCDQGKAVNIEKDNEDEFGNCYLANKHIKGITDWDSEACSNIAQAAHFSLPGTSSHKSTDIGDCYIVSDIVDFRGLQTQRSNDSDSDEQEDTRKENVTEEQLGEYINASSEDESRVVRPLVIQQIPEKETNKEISLNNSPLPLNNITSRSSNLSLRSPNRISPHQGFDCSESSQVLCNRVGGGQWLTSLEDILKESKTSNVNVLGNESTSQAPNNAIRFDSEKYPKVKDIRKKSGFEHNVLGASGKRSGWVIPPGLDLKRVKLDDDDDKNRPPSPPSPHKYLEKNIRLEEEMKERGGEAESAWRNHLAKNSSVIVSTFQGQLKSQVVCSMCQYVSITYEPFMYLSVPLPNAMKKQLRISFISKTSEITEVVLEVNKNELVQNMKEKLLNSLDLRTKGSVIVIGEVLNHHIAKLLDEGISVGSINDINRQIYAFEVVSIGDNVELKNDELIPNIETTKEDVIVEMTCAICLENKDTSIKKHVNCTFLICDSCVTPYCAHYSGSITCPVCRFTLNPSVDLKPVNSTSVPIRDVKVSLVYRVDVGRDVRLIGHPSLVRVPNLCTQEWLHLSLAAFIPYQQPFSIRVVDGQGLWCRRCLYAEHCRGCPIESNVRLNLNDTLAICLEAPPPDLPLTSALPLPAPASKHSLSIYDCINAFSQSEMLDENNPWFCPNCKKNQCATKSLSIWRFPDYLIVYLKRFVFHNHTSTKIEERVEFPLEGLDFSNDLLYDLYACVCHVGGVSAGHYTTYTLHSENKVWHYFNDSFVSKQAPQEKDFSSAYILFYRKRIS